MSLSIILSSLLLAGCVLNDTNQLARDSTANAARAVLIYGVGVEGKWNYVGLTVELTEYSVKDQAATGNCFTFNRTQAMVPAVPGPIRYFAFDVPPGHYVYSAFNAIPLKGETLAFTAGKGHVVYLGDFVYTQNNEVELRRGSKVTDRVLSELFPRLGGGITLSEVVAVRRPKMFLCAP